MVMIKDDIVRLVEEKLVSSSSSNYLVDVSIKPGNFIVVEIDDDESVSLSDCAVLSRYLEENLDRDKEDFELEVGSAGITSPFKILRQYKKNVGKEVEVQLKGSGGRIAGILKSADEQGIVITLEKKIKPEGAKKKIIIEEDQAYSFEDIKYTKYIIRFK